MYIDVQIRFFEKNMEYSAMHNVYRCIYYTCVARAPGHSPGHTRPEVYRAINIVY